MLGTCDSSTHHMTSRLGMIYCINKVRKSAKIRNRYNQVPHLTQDTNGKVTNSQLDITNESQEVSPFPASDHKASINRRARKHYLHKTEIRSTPLERSVKILNQFHGANLTLSSDVDLNWCPVIFSIRQQTSPFLS